MKAKSPPDGTFKTVYEGYLQSNVIVVLRSLHSIWASCICRCICHMAWEQILTTHPVFTWHLCKATVVNLYLQTPMPASANCQYLPCAGAVPICMTYAFTNCGLQLCDVYIVQFSLLRTTLLLACAIMETHCQIPCWCTCACRRLIQSRASLLLRRTQTNFIFGDTDARQHSS